MLAVSTNLPSGLKQAQRGITCFRGGVTGSPLATLQTWAVQSRLAVTTYLPSGLNDPCTTLLLCSRGLATGFPLAASHTRAVPSKLVVSTCLPSGLNSAQATLCPGCQETAWPV